MRSFPKLITDPVYTKPIYLTSYQKFWLKYIVDKRDLPFVSLLTIVHLTIVPVAVLLFTPFLGKWWWPVAIVYFYFSQFYFKGSFGLMLHCICHRKFFRPKSKFLYKYLFWFVCPLFGHLGESYHIHHLGMHHIENNMPTDTSCTMGYTRDSFRDFMKYWLRFMLLGSCDAFLYLFKRKRKKMYTRLTASELGFLVITTALCFFNFKATLIVFIIPFLFARLVMMIGNWTQHAFIDPDEPDNDLASNIICLNTSYNHKCWNDGYHAIHHVRPGAHYTDIPILFNEMIPAFEKNRTFIFEKIHYLHIFSYLMRKRYDKLTDHLINIGETFSDKNEVLELLKRRTRKFDLKNFVQNKSDQNISLARAN